jgi:hypothetical protein
LLARHLCGGIGESTLRQAQGDTCHGELVEPWIVRPSRTMTVYVSRVILFMNFLEPIKIHFHDLLTPDRHSREGGNPCFSVLSMDPRLREGDGFFAMTYFEIGSSVFEFIRKRLK